MSDYHEFSYPSRSPWMARKSVTRRKFLAGSLAGVAATGVWTDALAGREPADGSRQATGVKVGEVSDTSAIVWLRLTANARPLAEELRGACPGAAGRVRLRYGTDARLAGAKSTDWIDVAAKTDFSRQFRLSDLQPATVYHYAAETSGPEGKPVHA